LSRNIKPRSKSQRNKTAGRQAPRPWPKAFREEGVAALLDAQSRQNKRAGRPARRSWAKDLLEEVAAALVDAQRLFLAVMAFHPVLCRQALSNRDWDRVWELAEGLPESQRGVSWGVMERPTGCSIPVTVFDRLIDAAANCDPENSFIVPCKEEDGKLYLKQGDEWAPFPECLGGH
jgi:hypothetical protein